ncbi:MAG: protein TolQ, partial [Pseudomonadota bacterium]
MELETGYSMLELLQRADIVVKTVMIMLVIASFWSWAIIFDKGMKLGSLRRRANKFEDVFWSGRSLDDLYKNLGHKPDHPFAVVFVAAMREWKRSFEAGSVATGDGWMGLGQRIDKVMNVTISRELTSVERGLGFLATVGSTAPFIGLFGTVWGIMNSFQSIAASQDTSLAVVAPGIAEALFATALGLFAAIPAVIFYNRYSSQLDSY